MSDEEFEVEARKALGVLKDMSREEAIAAACLGSGDPQALGWILDSTGVDEHTRLLDVGGGLGGPAAWASDRSRCETVLTDPTHEAVSVARSIFGISGSVADGAALPFPDDSFDVVWLLGVLSVDSRADKILTEVRRIAPVLGLIAYVSVEEQTIEGGGSTFVTIDELRTQLGLAGWRVTAGPNQFSLSPPLRWERAADKVDSTDESNEVAELIDSGRISPVLLCAHRSAESTGPRQSDRDNSN